MNIKSCKFVEATEIFKDCPRMWEAFVEGDPPCTWGDNNRTMVTPDVISNFLDDFDFDEVHDVQKKLVNKRLDSLEDNVYIDLEN